MSSAEGGVLQRIGRAWNAFWFTPADPTPLALMRIVTGIVVIYVHVAYTLDLDAFFGPDGWYNVELVNRTRHEFPQQLGPTNWDPPPASYQLPGNASQRRAVRQFLQRLPARPEDRNRSLAFLHYLPMQPEDRVRVLDFLAHLPPNDAEREAALRRYVTDTLPDEEKAFFPEALLKVPAAGRPTVRDELRQFWDLLPRDDRSRTYVLAAIGEIYGIEPWKNFMKFLDDLPADPIEQARILDYMEYWTSDPRQLYVQGHPVYSPFFHVTDPKVLRLIHGLHLLVMVLFTLGVCTRVTSVLTWLAALSYINRGNPAILFGQDTMMNLCLFYLMLSPCGAVWSVDALAARYRAAKAAIRSGKRPAPAGPPTPLVSAGFATRLIQVNYCLIYLSAGLAKLKGDLWWAGIAPYYCMANPEFSPLHMKVYRDFLWLLCRYRVVWEIHMNAVTVFTLFTEIGLPFLIWTKARPLMVTVAILLHTGIAVLMGLNVFGLFMFCLMLCWFPAGAVRSVFARTPARLPRLRLLYGGRLRDQARAAATVAALDNWNQVEFVDAAPDRLRLVTPDGATRTGYGLATALADGLAAVQPFAFLLRLPGVAAWLRSRYREDRADGGGIAVRGRGPMAVR